MSKSYFFLKDIDTAHVAGDNKREAWMPKGDVPYYDKCMDMRFESRKHKRQVLKALGMRECGMTHDPRKAPPDGRMRKPVPHPAGYQRTGPSSFILH